jgi:hypothetical protein
MARQGRFVLVFRSVVLVGAAFLLVQCDRERKADPAPIAPETVPSVDIPVRPLAPPPPLKRADLITALAQAASVYAAGATVSGTDPLVGRTFSLKLPFGCGGPAATGQESGGVAQWQWSDDQTSIRLSMVPENWIASPLTAGAVVVESGASPENAWEAVEGFWIERPWLAIEGCPAASLSTTITAPPTAQSVGLVAVYPEGGSRLGRRNGRAYQHTLRAEGDTPLTPPTGGFALRLEGRVVGFPNDRAGRCVAFNPDQRPTCVVAVQLDRVAFETAATGETLAEWRIN